MLGTDTRTGDGLVHCSRQFLSWLGVSAAARPAPSDSRSFFAYDSGRALAPCRWRVHPSELGTEQDDLAEEDTHSRRVITDQSRGAIAGRHATLAEIQANQLLTNGEEDRGDECAGRDVAPAEPHVWQEAVEEGEQRGRHHERHEHVDAVPARAGCSAIGGRASHFNAAKAAVTARETISRKPIATTKPNERRRSVTKPRRFARGLGVTRQIVFSAAWSSRKAPVAATTNVMLPRAVARIPARR